VWSLPPGIYSIAFLENVQLLIGRRERSHRSWCANEKKTDAILLCTLQDRRDKGVEAKEKRKTVGGEGILVLTSEWSLINEP
jgi:hypothetical protein